MLLLGITGGLGSGKSTACTIFQQLGAEIFDADMVAKEILFSSEKVRDKIVEHFGNSVLAKGQIDKVSLSQIVFQDKNNQLILNEIIHPLVMEEYLNKKSQLQKDIFIMDAALLFEANLQHYFDKTILIYTDREIRIQRALNRGNLSKDQILKRMNLQMSEYRKKTLADYVISNNGSEEELNNKITELYKILV